MKKIVAVFSLVLINIFVKGQSTVLYQPTADAQKDIAAVTAQAKTQHKFVLIQAGGNWCGWCLEFERVSKEDHRIDSVIKNSYVVYHLNWSKENENKAVFASLGFPQRFGFPSFIILDTEGVRIHTQNSEYLEDGKKSYDHQKVQSFLEMWSPHALNPDMYGTK